MPALIGSILLLAGGAITAFLTAPKPDFDKMLEQAQHMVETEQYAAALEGLNTKLAPYAMQGHLSLEQQAEFHLLRGRSVYLGQQRIGIDAPENARTVIDELGAAKKAGKALDGRDVYFLADSWVALSDYPRALELAAELPPGERSARARIYRRIVEDQLKNPGVPAELSLKLLAEFLQDMELTAADRAWALARQAQLLIRSGEYSQAISRLVQTMPSLIDSAGAESTGELHLLLGRAYFESAALPEARRQLAIAADLLIPTDERWALATVLLGRVEEMTLGVEEARAEARLKYQTVIARFTESSARLPAMLALGELEGAGRDSESVDSAIAAYSQLVQELEAGRNHAEVDRAKVSSSLMGRALARASEHDHASALRYGALAEQLHPAAAVPAELLLMMAGSHRSLAEGLLHAGEGSALLELTRLDPAAREQARMHLLTGGAYFKRHADRVGIADNASFGRSLWLSADCYDLAGDPEQAIALFTEYVKFFPDDPRQGEARYRLGQAYQARGDYLMASEQYRTLLVLASEGPSGRGPFADLSAVPLSQCLLLDSDTSNDAEAEALLWQVVQGKLGGVGTPQYRDALVELASLEARRGAFAGAIQNLEEAITRYPEDPQIATLLYNLGDAYRQDARSISRTLQEALPDSRKMLLTEARMQRLRRAQELFDRTADLLGKSDPRQLSQLEKLQLRNSAFFAADCSFDQRDFEQAIRRYDAAREKYSSDPASLVAMIQIVNAYVEMGDEIRAETANERAKLFYQSLPATAWSDPSLPIGVQDWQRWLDSMSVLKPLGGASGKAKASVPEEQP